MRMESIFHSRSGRRNVAWVECINVEGYMDWKLRIFSHEVNCLLWCVMTNVVFLNRFGFKIVNVSNTDVDKFVERKLLQTNS